MNELTKREQMALAMLQGHSDLVRCHMLLILPIFSFPYQKIQPGKLYPKWKTRMIEDE